MTEQNNALVQLEKALQKSADPTRALASSKFFRTGPGQYGEGDKFLGVRVPQQRLIAKQFYKVISLDDTLKLLKSKWHEYRLTAIIILVTQYQKADASGKKIIANAYHKNRRYVNNWDLVDSSAPYILGDYLLDHARGVLYRLAKSSSVWDRRIAIITTLNFIRNGEFVDTLKLSELLLDDKHDLMHKAVGWCLREVGKKDRKTLLKFLDQHAKTMPRTALRYAIEHLPPEQRQHYMGVK